ncbi:FISUMP domain-containing protein [Mucilaginibacter sp.]
MKKLLYSLLITMLVAGCGKSSVTPTDTTNTSSGGTTTPGKVTIGGSEYSTVVIGTQTWTAVNYNGSGGYNYNNSSVSDVNYGKLYTLAEAKAISLPSGWRLPTKADAEVLLKTQGNLSTITSNGIEYEILNNQVFSTKLFRSTAGWSVNTGTNATGFNAYPAGYATTDLKFSGLGLSTDFWTSTAYASTTYPKAQYTLSIYAENLNSSVTETIGLGVTLYGDKGLSSIRFVKDN